MTMEMIPSPSTKPEARMIMYRDACLGAAFFHTQFTSPPTTRGSVQFGVTYMPMARATPEGRASRTRAAPSAPEPSRKHGASSSHSGSSATSPCPDNFRHVSSPRGKQAACDKGLTAAATQVGRTFVATVPPFTSSAMSSQMIAVGAGNNSPGMA